MARERYLVGAGEDTIHTNVIELKTAKQKRENWWFYNKRILLFVILGVAMLISLVWSIVTRVEPDYTIGMILSYSIPDDLTSALEDYLTLYADDRNGDGKVVVRVSTYVFSSDVSTSNDMQAIQAAYARFAGDCSLGSVVIYMHDQAGFNSLRGEFAGFFQYNDGTPMPDEAKDFDNAMRPWSDIKGLEHFPQTSGAATKWSPEVTEELCSRLRISARTAVDSNLSSNDKLLAYYEDSMELLDRLMTGTPLGE